MQFSNRAFLRCPNGLAAGTYNVTIGANWGNNAVKDTTWKFTLAQAVPEGGSVAGFTQMPDVAPSNWKATSYAADGITKIETVAISSGTTEDGTNLGTMNFEPWKTYPNMIRYSAANHTSPQSVFSRSANRGYANHVMLVGTSGSVNGTYAWHAITYAPLVFV